MLIDDCVDVVDALAEVMREEGHQVFTAHNGSEGLAAFDAFEPDLAIVDLEMPEIDGFKLARYVRTDARFRVTPMIALSGLAGDHVRERTRKVGFDAHVAKPPDMSRLHALVRRLTA